MGIAVKRGDFLFLFVNGITALVVRGNASVRPRSWWHRAWQKVVSIFGDGSDPFNVFVDVTSTTDRSGANAGIEIQTDGEIDAAQIVINGTLPAGPGEIFAALMVSRAGSSGAFALLASGYIHGLKSPTYPGVPQGPLDGPGRYVKQTLAQPAAGVDFANASLPTNARWRKRGFFGQLVTGAGVANREFSIRSFDGVNTVEGTVANEIQTASLTLEYLGANPNTPSGTSGSLSSGVIGIGLSDMLLTTSFGVTFKTYNLQAADQWTGSGFLSVEEWISP